MNMAQISFHLQNKPPFLWDPLSLSVFKVLGQSSASCTDMHFWVHLWEQLALPLHPSTSLSFSLAQGLLQQTFHRPKKPQASRKQPFLLSGALRYRVRFGPRNSMIRSANQPESYRNKMCLPTITKGRCGSLHLVE